MRKHIEIDLDELVEAQVIDHDTATAIATFYEEEPHSSEGRFMAIFGVIGAILIGLGVILIFAHNWDHLSRPIKTGLAFAPLIACQVLGGYVLFKKMDSAAWREVVSTLWFFSIGTCMALVSQIYQLSGSMSSFLLVWIVMAIPIVFLLRSKMVGLLVILWITCFVFTFNINYSDPLVLIYFPVMTLMAFFYYRIRVENTSTSAADFFYVLFFTLSPLLCFWFFTNSLFFQFAIPIALFGSYFLLGNSPLFDRWSGIANAPLWTGALGFLVFLFILSFQDATREIAMEIQREGIIWDTGAILFLLLCGVYGYIFIKRKSESNFWQHPMHYLFPICFFVLMFVITSRMSWLPNIVLFGLGIFYISRSEREQHLGWLNLGLMIISLLIAFRFFDVDISFVIKGMIFILLGVGFLLGNLRILRKRKN